MWYKVRPELAGVRLQCLISRPHSHPGTPIGDEEEFQCYVATCYTHLDAVVDMASTDSIILCKAESVPMVMSVPQKSLSIEPTIPTMFR